MVFSVFFVGVLLATASATSPVPNASVECTRPNEEWSPCRSPYDYESCDDHFNSPPVVPQPGDDKCNPRCTCIEGYFKNNAYECVPEKECPPSW